jgi:hypothetical protein
MFLALAVCSLGEETNDLYTDLEQFFSQLEHEELVSVEIKDAQIKLADPNVLLRLLEPHQVSQNAGVRSFVYKFEAKAAHFHPHPPVRNEVVGRLVNALVSKDEIDRELHGTYAELLYGFEGKDFSQAANAAILRALQADNPRKELIRVSGVAQLKEALPRLEELLIDEQEFNRKHRKLGRKWYYTPGWNARLARARMGIEDDINRCIQLVGSVEDTRLKVYHLLPAIAYIRRPEAVGYLQEHLNSNMILKTDRMEEPVAAYVLDLLGDCLRDFPIEKKAGRGYGQEDIERARHWMTQHKEWNIVR